MNQNPVSTSPQLLDSVLAEIQQALKTQITWLDQCYGRAQCLVRKNAEGKDVYFPAIYTSEQKFHSLLPGADVGNYSFFDIPDSYTFASYNRFQVNKLATPYRLVVWCDESKIWATPNLSDRESLKAEVLRLLRHTTLFGGGLWVESLCERPVNVFAGYSLADVDAQYLKYPYGGFAIEGRLEFTEKI